MTKAVALFFHLVQKNNINNGNNEKMKGIY